MKILLQAVVVIVAAALGAGGVLYADSICPKKKAQQQEQINKMLSAYIENNSGRILELLAKNENFGQTVKNFAGIGNDDLKNAVNTYITDNPAVIEQSVQNNIETIAAAVLASDMFKNKAAFEKSETTEEVATEDNSDKIFIEHWDEMKNNPAAPAVGPQEAKVTVVEFFDFACGHCKALAPVMRQLIKNNPDVRFVFLPLFFISEHSPYAAKVSLAAAQKGKFTEVYEGIMTLPEMNEEKINQILSDEGLDIDEIKKMIEEKSIRRGVQDIDALSQVLGINGVPMLLINGEPFYGRNLEDLQNKLNSYK